MNLLLQQGRLTKDPELKESKNGVKYCKFGIAIRRTYQGKLIRKDANGKTNQAVDFMNWTCFRAGAEYLCAYGHRGDVVNIIGHVAKDMPVKGDKSKVDRYSLIADTVELLLAVPRDYEKYNQEDTLATIMNMSEQTLENEARYDLDGEYIEDDEPLF